MSFGKRTPGQQPDIRKALLEANARAKAEAASVVVDAPAPTTSQAKRVEFDAPKASASKGAKGGKKSEGAFVALALGVMVVSAGGAFAAPEVINWAQNNVLGTPVRPIATVVAGLDHDHAKAALAKEAFPDADGKAFMTALQASYPADHSRLLDQMTDIAMNGGDRNALLRPMDNWSIGFSVSNFQLVGRTGARGFDRVMTLVDDVLTMVDQAAGGDCSIGHLQTVVADPSSLKRIQFFGADGYKLNMRANLALVQLAAEGSHAPMPETALLPEDNEALQKAMMSLMNDPQVMSLVQSVAGGMGPGSRRAAPNMGEINNLNVCKLGHVAVDKLRTLPDGTKSRLLAMALNHIDAGTLARFQQMAEARYGV